MPLLINTGKEPQTCSSDANTPERLLPGPKCVADELLALHY